MIYADAQDLGVQSRKLGMFSLVRRDLTRSDRRPGKRIEHNHHILAAQVAQGKGFPQVRRQGEIRRQLISTVLFPNIIGLLHQGIEICPDADA